MEWLVYFIGGILISISSGMVGFIIRDKQLGKFKDFVLQYKALTPKSKNLVDGYIYSRSVNDERTTYRER